MAQLDTNSDERLARLKAGLSDDPRASRWWTGCAGAGLNILAGVTLHAAPRQEHGLELTELEDSLLRVLREPSPTRRSPRPARCTRQPPPHRWTKSSPAWWDASRSRTRTRY
ncbi:hypothetical protein [Streptomyces sp. MJM1172]|uniref:hypothetical protein n=1 Tax=Streptomyces sp. MJM1172 TaxID=1703926 RepID=UPI000939E9BC|nr:hypothetical protein [Streptomyces sp. MJM1172]OKI49058.1 hypothetical protein AMK15_34450 [Streptomyces sp. MJM1172]